MKEVRVVQADGGYIVTTVDQQNGQQALKVFTNFGAVVKHSREFFGETIVKGSKVEEVAQNDSPVPATE